MDIRRFFNDGEKGKDDSSEKKRPTEEGASARPPPPLMRLLSLSSLASLVKRPKQLSFFPHASVRKTSFRSMNLYLDYLLS